MSRRNRSSHGREKKTSKVSFLCSAAALAVLCFGFKQADRILIQEPMQKEEAQRREAAEEKEALEPVVTTADIVAVGDNLFHTKLYESV